MLKTRLKNIITAIKSKEDVTNLKETLANVRENANREIVGMRQTIDKLRGEARRHEETIHNLHNDLVQVNEDNAELITKVDTLTKHCTDLVSRVETMKRDMNTQIKFMELFNTAINTICDGIKDLPERMESIEKGYLNPLPTEYTPTNDE